MGTTVQVSQSSDSQEAREMREADLRALPVAVIGIGVATVMLAIKWVWGRAALSSKVARMF